MSQASLPALRQSLAEHGLDAYLLPHSDPHQSEYLPEHWRLMPWLTGFTGSAGTVVVTQDFAGVWTDSRYFIQAAEQLAGSGFELMKLKVPHTPEYIEWLTQNLGAGQKVGVDPRLLSLSQAERLQKAFAPQQIELQAAPDLATQPWQDRPALPNLPIVDHPVDFAGKSRVEKLKQLRDRMAERQIDWHLFSALDDLAWLFNLRGSDVAYNPVFLGFALVGQQEAHLFLHASKLPPTLAETLLAEGITLHDYADIDRYLAQLDPQQKLYFPSIATSWHLAQQWPQQQATQRGNSLVAEFKAVKNHAEIQALRQVMIRDGVAMVRFLHWLTQAVHRGEPVTEVSAAERLEHLRAQQPNFVGPSFGTIAGYGPNGAIVHYSAQPESCATLRPEGIFLLDSGGQYLDGTTDITRTIALGPPTEQQRADYTRVLQGHVELAMAVFPEGTGGHQLDILARLPLWQQQQNFGHGTGHGVGAYLNVHEGPQRISPSASAAYPFAPGMITSNEPGLYHEGQYGIRIENLILCVEADEDEAFGRFFRFQTLSLCPLDRSLIDPTLLTPVQIAWINQYHQQVYEALSPHLDAEELAWLKEHTGGMGSW